MKIPINPLFFAPILGNLLKVWAKSIRFKQPDKIKEYLDDKPVVGVLWHDEMFALIGYGYKYDVKGLAMASSSKDGEFITKTLEYIGYKAVRGSSSRDGVRALLNAKRIMVKEGLMAVITVDGPRGPRHEPKDGAIFLAHRAGAKILPLRAFPKKKKVFDKSWDKFQVPYPFTSCEIVCGEPYEIKAEKLDAETMAKERKRMKEKMDVLESE